MASLKKNIVVLNFAGTVGKSTITKQLLSPMLGDSIRIQIESINNSAVGADHEIDATQFKSLSEQIALKKNNLLIDIGGSNIESVLNQISKMDGIQEDIDHWIIPVDERQKVIVDTLNTVGHLVNKLDIDPKRITVIANNIEFPTEIQTRLAPIFKAATQIGINFSEIGIMKSDLFDIIKDDKRSVFEIASDPTDFNALIANENDEEKLAHLGRAKVHRFMARSLEKNLRAVWQNTPLAA